PRTRREGGTVSELSDGAGRRAEDGGSSALPRRGVACRSAQDRSAGLLGRRAYGRGGEHALREAPVPGCGRGRQGKRPSGLRGGSLSGTSGGPRDGFRAES